MSGLLFRLITRECKWCDGRGQHEHYSDWARDTYWKICEGCDGLGRVGVWQLAKRRLSEIVSDAIWRYRDWRDEIPF